jgi:hypothetical protein
MRAYGIERALLRREARRAAIARGEPDFDELEPVRPARAGRNEKRERSTIRRRPSEALELFGGLVVARVEE